MDRDETSRRIRAARALAVPTDDELQARKRPVVGITVDELARRIDTERLGAKTLGNMERGDVPALRPALTEVARACGLPYEFFTADLATLGDTDRASDGLEDDLAAIGEALFEIVAAGRSGVGPATAESLRARLENMRARRGRRDAL